MIFWYFSVALELFVVTLGVLLGLILFYPISLEVNSTTGNYRVSFIGGFFRYENFDSVQGIRWKFLLSKGFIPFTTLFKKKEKKPKPDRKKKTGKKAASEKEEKEPLTFQGHILMLRKLLSLASEEKSLAVRILRSFGRMLVRILESFKLRYAEGTFYVKNPFACGLYYAALGPCCRENRCVVPNFTGDNVLKARMDVIPGEILGSILSFLITLPYIRGYMVYQKIKRIRKDAASCRKGGEAAEIKGEVTKMDTQSFKDNQSMVERVAQTITDTLKDLARTETVIGKPFQLGEFQVVPVLSVKVGFGTGGSNSDGKMPAGGGGGAGVQVEPIAFLVAYKDQIELINLGKGRSLETLLEAMPGVIGETGHAMVDIIRKVKSGKGCCGETGETAQMSEKSPGEKAGTDFTHG